MDNTSSFDDLIIKSGSVRLHHRNLQQLAIEIYNVLNNLSSLLMSELFKVKERNHLRNEIAIVPNRPRTTKYGINSISHLAPKIWELIPKEIKSCKTLNLFKVKIKTWIPENCPCNLCRPYIHGVGFI